MKVSLPKLTAASVIAIFLSLLFAINTFAATPSTRPTPRGSLTPTRLQSCQARENAIKNRSESLLKLAATMQEKFDSIAERVKEYYTTKLVPEGKTIANYDALLSDIQTKKQAVETALTKAQNDIVGFSCANDNPRALLTKFNQDMRAVKAALKDYRTSIKNLIVGVRSVTGQENRTNQ